MIEARQSEITIPSKLEHLRIVNNFLKGTLSKFGLEKPEINEIQIAVSEACTNVIQYGYSNSENGTIEIVCYRTDGNYVVKIRDYGEPFNPLAVTPPNVEAGISERAIGGLGVFFMKQLLDELSYEYNDERGYETLTMIKYDRDPKTLIHE